MTWSEALRHADDQIAHWHATGVSLAEAEKVINITDPDGLGWEAIRHWLATWAMCNRESWKD